MQRSDTRVTLGALWVVLPWAIAGAGVGVVVAWRTAVVNDSLESGRDSMILAGWLALLYGGAFALVSVVPWWLTRHLSGGWSKAAAHLACACVFVAVWMAGNWYVERFSITTGLAQLLAAALPVAGALAVAAAVLRRVPLPVLIGTAVVLLGGVGAVLLAAPREAPSGRSHPSDAVPPITPAPRTILLIGLDGAEWNFIDPLVAAGRLPTFRALIAAGFRGPLQTIVPTHSPIIWTTIATGVPEEVHGIHGFTEVHIPGLSRGIQGLLSPPLMVPPYVRLREAAHVATRTGFARVTPVTSMHRRVKSLWNIFSDHGVPVVVVNWFATWPAEPVNGYLVSDRNRIAFRAGAYGPPETRVGLTYPPELSTQLDAVLAANPADTLPPLHFFGTTPSPIERERFSGVYDADGFAAGAARYLAGISGARFLAVYLSGIDVCSHYFLKANPQLIERYYEFVDKKMSELIAAVGSDATVVVVSDHGWGFRPGEPFSHFHGPDGVLIMAGPGIPAGTSASVKPSIFDITPTVLSLMGLPKARNMPGRVLTEVLPAEHQTRLAVIESFGAYVPPATSPRAAAGSGVEAETVERLRALGYQN